MNVIDKLDVVALLTQLECIVSEYFEDNEPVVSRCSELAANILCECIADGLIITDQELADIIHKYYVYGLKI